MEGCIRNLPFHEIEEISEEDSVLLFLSLLLAVE